MGALTGSSKTTDSLKAPAPVAANMHTAGDVVESLVNAA
jgi:hypothetical protein